MGGGQRLQRRLLALVFLSLSLVSFQRARSAPFGLKNRFLWVSTVTMAFMLRQLLPNLSSKLVTDHSKVGRKVAGKGGDFDGYDFIIVGGGTAGCAMAARLSEDPSVRVLVLEAGGSGKSLMFSRIPIASSLLFRSSKHGFQLYTEPQAGAQNQKKFWPRAKMLGGCSSINALMAQYGAPQDYDEWAKIAKDEAWSWKNFSQYIKKFENYQQDSRYPDVDISVKGTQGPVRIGYLNNITQSSLDFIEACKKVGVPYSPDFNTPSGACGVNRNNVDHLVTYIDENRTRVSSESAYFTKDVLSRPNLVVVINATVTKVLLEKNGEETRAIGVEFAKDRSATRFAVRAKKEVILAAGAIHSPHILLLSGVGPADHLKSKNIPVIQDLPVGSNLIDHPVVDTFFKDRNNRSPKHVKPKTLPDAIKFLHSLYEYLVYKRGPLSANPSASVAFIRSDDPNLFPESEFSNEVKDSTSGNNAPDLEIFVTPIAYKEHGRVTFSFHTLALHAVLLRPLSKGTLCLKTTDPFDLPAVDPRYLSAPEDVEKLRRGLRFIFKVAKQDPLASHIDFKYKNESFDTDTASKSDEELEDLIRDRVETLYHPAGTCRMAAKEDGGVVDSHLRVYGIKNLRVADASIFPEIVAGHTAGACLAIGEFLADALKTEYGLLALL